MPRFKIFWVMLFVAGASASASTASIGNVTEKRLLQADAEPGQWFTGGRDYRQDYYSPLTGINKHNVGKLGFAWSRDIDPPPVLEATPIVVDGVLYTSGGSDGPVYSVDAKSGAPRWAFKPQVDATKLHYPVSRGVAVWKGKVYFGAGDGWLYALDADSGKVIWRVDTVVDHSRVCFITGAPYIADDAVVIGNGGAEFDARGYVTAYEAATGKERWRFFTVPGDPHKGFEHPELEMAAKTWDPNSRWDVGLGGTAWDGMAYDPHLELLYVGTGNGVPYPRSIRSPSGGDNLFLASILAINVKTGRLVWHYQTVPGDQWDYTATQKLVLADLKIDGKVRKTIMQAPKNGFFYVLDRESGKLLSAKPYAYLNWASHVDLKTGRPVETIDGDYSKEPKLIFPGDWGAHNWQPMAFNRRTGLVYVPVLETGVFYGHTKESFVYRPKYSNLGLLHLSGEVTQAELPKEWPKIESLRAGKRDPRARTYLRAWDPVRQSLVWEVETTAPTSLGKSGGNPAGVMTTASGLVLQGHVDGDLFVFDAETGKQLARVDVGDKMVAAPMTYLVGKEQYVAIMGTGKTRSGTSHPKRGRIVAFRLGGGPVPRPSNETNEQVEPPPLANQGTPQQIELGSQLFARHCSMCHLNGEKAPFLPQMSAEAHRQFGAIVLNGARLEKSMPGFGSVLSVDDANAIYAYVNDLAWNYFDELKSKESKASGALK